MADDKRLVGSVRFEKEKIIFNEGKGDTQTLEARQMKVMVFDRQAAAIAAVAAPEIGSFLPPADPAWHYRKGTSEASNPVDAWRKPGFVMDGSWLVGKTPIGYGDNDDATVLDDMLSSYTTVYLRHEFKVARGAVPERLTLRVYYDDAAIVWINGVEVGRFSAGPGEMAFNAMVGDHEASWVDHEIPNAGTILLPGTNLIAVHAFNRGTSSTDFSIDAELKQAEPGLVATNAKVWLVAGSMIHAQMVAADSRSITLKSGTGIIRLPLRAIALIDFEGGWNPDNDPDKERPPGYALRNGTHAEASIKEARGDGKVQMSSILFGLQTLNLSDLRWIRLGKLAKKPSKTFVIQTEHGALILADQITTVGHQLKVRDNSLNHFNLPLAAVVEIRPAPAG